MKVVDPASFELSSDPSAWYDLWHTHVDWDGVGDADVSARQRFIATLFALFERAVDQTSQWDRPSNVWVLFHPNSSADDALYVHTQNPNSTPFPYEFKGVSWGVEPHPLLRPFIEPEYEVGLSDYAGGMYWVRMRHAT